MKPVWIAFHLFMVVIYLSVGGILIFTRYFPVIEGVARIVLGIAFMAMQLSEHMAFTSGQREINFRIIRSEVR